MELDVDARVKRGLGIEAERMTMHGFAVLCLMFFCCCDGVKSYEYTTFSPG
jgi:hypothetical protein